MTGWASRSGRTRSRRASGARAARASAAAGTRSRWTPTEQATTTSSPDVVAAAGDGDGRVAQVRDAGPPAARGAARRSRCEPGRARGAARSQRSGASWLSGWRWASGRRCSSTMSRTRASWSIGGRPACDHRGHLAVGLPDADLEHRLVDRRAGRGRAVDDAGDLEAEHLAAHDAVLDDHLEVGVDEQLRERRSRRRVPVRPGSAPARPATERRARRPRSTVGGDVNSAARRATRRRVGVVDDERSRRSRRAGPPTPGPARRRSPGRRRAAARPTDAVDQGGAAREARPARAPGAPTRARELGG